MATIFSLSPKSGITGRHEILIRYKSGEYAARAKSGIFTTPDWYHFVIGNKSDDPYKGKRLITPEMEEIKTYHNDQKAKFAEIISKIDEELKIADKNNSEWLVTVIDKYHNPIKYNPKATEPEIKTLFQFVTKFIEEAPNRKDKNTGRPLTYNNIQQYKATEKHLKDFAKSIRKKDFEFLDINQSFYDKYVSFLQEKDFTQNSVGKHIRVLKLMLNEATIQGYNTNAYYNSFHVFTEETDTIYLNENELQQLKDTNFSKIPHLDRVRDWFLLLAWTGSRFSDLEKVAKTDIKEGFITFRQQKTNAKVVIPLHPVVLEILEKYNYNLPAAITNQRFNEYIKEACRIAGINTTETMTRTVGGELITEKFEKWEHVSSHTGRRSFCTNMYKRGLPTLMIMSISGHKTEKSFLKYIKVKQNEHAEMMKEAWENMYK
jgi:integrase